MARIVRFHEFGGPEVLQIDDVPVGEPGAGEVRVRVGAFGLNRVETLYRSGQFGPVTFPARIGYEMAGTVDAVGTGVTQWRAGDRVAALFGQSMEDYGTHGEQVLYPADLLVPVPRSITLEQAAASWMQYGTAYALVEVAHISAGQFVVINAASSSVGLAAIQIALREGAVPIAITRGRDKASALAELGATHVIVSDEEDVPARIMAITNGQGAQVAFDAVGGEPLSALLTAMAPQGIVIIYGMLAGYQCTLALPPLMLANLTLRGFSADLLVRDAASRHRLADYVGSGLADGTLIPVIDRCFSLDDIVEAHRHLESNRQIGKIVVTV
ncbi:zinc-dependent alcohol dehydrogenase family protein [Novosphingobium album (ex Hu et al. 2023)]|uniref:Zinc-dependent alcohol dehydrogenase family protein n=1 Tax=Novosphingobium album (ex Hu et al. 2023) TaxID=2930093 RepID=A0ABT0B5E3_9SPHN|nr:zinc-dependent alcohol dehydrogenase family protein [Novosphingobium album (ex Hu et al. 2023)]MCJ2180029.1 zinc-dependent alcohol dehydrogenase family protein [Novosphingobium album (ex Hu et al. 2023)]